MLDEAETLMFSVASEASAMLMAHFDLPKTIGSKDDGSAFTDTDVAIEKMARGAIRERFPSHGFIGEESGADLSDGKFVWICDPIDGTRPFILGLPLSTFTLTLCRSGKPVLTVIAYPFMQQTFSAREGKGAWVSDQRPSVGDTRRLSVDPELTLQSGGVDILSSIHRHAIAGIHDRLAQERIPQTASASAAVMATCVATGKLAASVWCDDCCWDAACVKLLVEEAGGTVTNLDGYDQLYDRPVKGYVATNGTVHNELITLLQRPQLHIDLSDGSTGLRPSTDFLRGQ